VKEIEPMLLNEALAKLAPGNGNRYIAVERAGRPRVRRAVGHDEQQMAAYVFDGDAGAEAFDATVEDLAATDWTPIARPVAPAAGASR
jgi:hypothetical protein